jgi:hypothetical protein
MSRSLFVIKNALHPKLGNLREAGLESVHIYSMMNEICDRA